MGFGDEEVKWWSVLSFGLRGMKISVFPFVFGFWFFIEKIWVCRTKLLMVWMWRRWSWIEEKGWGEENGEDPLCSLLCASLYIINILYHFFFDSDLFFYFFNYFSKSNCIRTCRADNTVLLPWTSKNASSVYCALGPFGRFRISMFGSGFKEYFLEYCIK